MNKPLKPNPKLQALWRDLDPKQRKRFAALAGKTAGSLRHVVDGRRGISSDLAIKLEKASVRMALKPLDRMALNETCGKCEFARYCKKVSLV